MSSKRLLRVVVFKVFPIVLNNMTFAPVPCLIRLLALVVMIR